MSTIAPMRELRGVDAEMFRSEIFPAAQPVVMRGLAAQWPAVAAGAQSAQAMADYLKRMGGAAQVEFFHGPPEIQGRFWYRDDHSGLNFERRSERLGAALDQLLSLIDAPAPPAIYAGAVSTPDIMPDFERDNPMPLVGREAAPRIWIGNKTTISTHFDISDNIACVVAGRRRFTLFPPEQLGNLYVGPLEFTIAGQPASMVPPDGKAHSEYPRYDEALAAAQSAELEPGDAIYIPYLWWHNVHALDPFSVLVNYWWDDSPLFSSPFVALVHAILAVRDLPAHRRTQWRGLFEHFVFEADEATAAHLTPRLRGIQAPMNAQSSRLIMNFLKRTLDN
jgi:hypothetical protein